MNPQESSRTERVACPLSARALGPRGLIVSRLPGLLAGTFFLWSWASSLRAEIFEGSGFQALNWNMPISDAENSMGGQLSRVRNEHTGAEYLRAERYFYLGCTYVLILNFENRGVTLSEIVLNHRRDTKAEATERSCHDGLSTLTARIGLPISTDRGVRMWRLKATTITVMEGRLGDIQIRYKPAD